MGDGGDMTFWGWQSLLRSPWRVRSPWAGTDAPAVTPPPSPTTGCPTARATTAGARSADVSALMVAGGRSYLQRYRIVTAPVKVPQITLISVSWTTPVNLVG